jgi:hypothetical protein
MSGVVVNVHCEIRDCPTKNTNGAPLSIASEPPPGIGVNSISLAIVALTSTPAVAAIKLASNPSALKRPLSTPT